MALRFISHKEIAFRQLLGLLRTPPVAVMNYYTNLFLSARFVLSDQPDKIRFLDKEIRRVECLVGVFPDGESSIIQDKLDELTHQKRVFQADLMRLESMYDNASEEEKKEIIATHDVVAKKITDVDRKEHFLLFKLNPLMNLKIIETYMDNNMDLKSFFKEHGKVITQLELMSELERVKIWVYQEAVQLMPYVRFTKLE